MIGELDAGNPHVQFDEGAQETCDSVTRLCPTLQKSPDISIGDLRRWGSLLTHYEGAPFQSRL
jgi:hypothetical protein